ncbi:photosystem I reaction center subunit XI [Kovacikia minuta CCNUW1]|uniref:photosystem I reaction center subunit XI n=1 Tax=Kovacikia minuta TaxID=2931930 RepID=UPI001CCC9E2E|nr:photosystem I reaction center subunit XI [Kovacikia minuta]UBF25814.1 photosystem I reaction center subunit XI [Kovacikia minuta CCNUW1]
MTNVVERIDRSADNPKDPRNREVVYPAWNDPQLGNLATPINSSGLTKTLINNLPAYRRGLSPFRRGLEVGLAHGYWLLGPFVTFNPLRLTVVGNLVGLLATISTIIISTLAISLYAASDPPAPVATITTPNPPRELREGEGWNEYAGGFLIGGVGGAAFAYFILTSIDLIKGFSEFLGS